MDGVVGGVEVGHQEGDVLIIEVLGCAKLEEQRYLTQRLGCSTRYNPLEWRVDKGEVFM
jgi:hypothetical protein